MERVGIEPTFIRVKSPVQANICYRSIGVNDGARTRNRLCHKQGLYQLSYVHHCTLG